MLEGDFYESVLIPVKDGSSLYIVSGYATPAMASRHIKDIVDRKFSKIDIHLIIGMTAKDGIGTTNHKEFCSLVKNSGIKSFQCAYVPDGEPPVHTKAYAWFHGKDPLCGYIGSANYTQTGFFFNQKEAMEESDPQEILDYYETVQKTAILCDHKDMFRLVKDDKRSLSRPNVDGLESWVVGQNSVICTLLDESGNLPKGPSGLNWGQRSGREPNQAYIRVPSNIQKGFFPSRGYYFSMHTDDGEMFICSVRQDGDKAIQSSQNNSLLGKYFRRRLGVPLGDKVEKSHLEKYGRTDITFYKIDDENYMMDFSV